MQKFRPIAAITLVLGLLLYGSSLVLPSMLYGSGWTEDDAREFEKLGRQFHAASFQRYAKSDDMGHGSGTESVEMTYEELEVAFNNKKAQLEASSNGGTGLAFIMKWLGILTAVGSGVAFVVLGTIDTK